MTCCGGGARACEGHFDRKVAARDLRDYQKNGPVATTRALTRALVQAGVNHATVLDIGGGVGAIQHELLGAGARTATSVDASSAYQDVARQEATRRGLCMRIAFRLGDFVDLASQIPAADVVTLDRVVCCYPLMEPLVRLSAQRCSRLYGLVYPRDRLLTRLVIRVQNFIRGLLGNPFRSFVHSTDAMDALIRSSGFTLLRKTRTFVWEVAVYQATR